MEDFKVKSIEIKKETIIYVLCPAYVKTGGPELLHQLVKELNDNGVNAYITYYNIKKGNTQYRNVEFDKYAGEYKLLKDIEDDEKNYIITPEVVPAIKQIEKLKNIKKIIWWLSVDNFLNSYTIKNALKMQKIKPLIKALIKNEIMYSFDYIKKVNYHLCQSKYAIEFLREMGINNIDYLSDYLNDEYLNINENEIVEKENIVLYNPKKGFEFTQKIMEKSSDLKWVPIQNLTTKQVKELLLRSKVYIDFGNHPGKDRFPRESAMCNCCVITGKRGSAKYHQDVPISDEFKFDDKLSEIDNIIEKIKLCLNDYDNQITKYEEYRNFIKGEKEKFKSDVRRIFKKK